MKLLLGSPKLQTEFEFTLPQQKKAVANLPLARKMNYEINKLGVYLSGGLDSAALLCLILAELQATNNQDNYLVHCFIIDKNEGQAQHALNVIKEAERIFDVNINFDMYNNEPNDYTKPGRISNTVYKKISDQYTGMMFYQGLNDIPSADIKTFNSTFEGYKNLTEHSSLSNKPAHFPFLKLHKPQILDIFYKLNCESVIQYTQSCTRKPSGQCGECYWCEERSWAFNMLSKTDPQLKS